MSKHDDGAEKPNCAPPTDDEPKWEDIARHQLEREGEHISREVGQSLQFLASKFGDGDATPDHVKDARGRLVAAHYFLEDNLAPIIDDVTPHGGGSLVSTLGDAAEFLNVTVPQTNEVRRGINLELTDVVRKELAGGHTVALESDADIEVTLAPDRPEPVTHDVTLHEEDLRALLNGDSVRHGLGDGQAIVLEFGDAVTPNPSQ